MVLFSHMSFLDSLFAKKEKSVLGVDIGSSSLKVVQLRKDHGKAVLETYGELALGPYGGSEVGQATNLSAEQVTETLKDLLREAKVTTTSCGVSIPFARSLLTLVTLPYRKDPTEQKTVIELEARKYIPVPIAKYNSITVVPKTDPAQSRWRSSRHDDRGQLMCLWQTMSSPWFACRCKGRACCEFLRDRDLQHHSRRGRGAGKASYDT
jgi:hypothetical protein